MASIFFIKAHILSYADKKDFGILPASASTSGTRAESIDKLLNQYWSTIQGDDFKSQNIANLLLEWCFTIGNAKTAIALTQKLAKVPADGIVGPAMIKKMNAMPAKAFFVAYHEYIKKWYQEKASNSSLKASSARSIEILDTLKCNMMIFSDGVKFSFSDTPTTSEINVSKSYWTKYIRRAISLEQRTATGSRPTTNSSAGSRPASATGSASKLNYDIWAPFFISYVGGFSSGNTSNPLNKGVRLSIWKECGRDLNKDGKIDVEDLKLITDSDASAATKKYWWERNNLGQLKSQNVAIAILDWLWFTGDSAKSLIFKAIGSNVNASNFIEEANKQSSNTLFTTIKNARKAAWEEQIKNDPSKKSSWDGWMQRLDAIQYNQLTCKYGQKITFTDEGTLVKDGTKADPNAASTLNFDIWAPFYISYVGGFSSGNTSNPLNKGVRLSIWQACGRDLNKDGKIDVEDLKLITNDDAIAATKKYWWDKYRLGQLKSQNVANAIVDWLWFTGDSAENLVYKAIGPNAISSNFIEEANKQAGSTLLSNIKKARKAAWEEQIKNDPSKQSSWDGWIRRLNAIQYNELTTKDGRKISFTDEGLLINDGTAPAPKYEIWEAFYHSHNEDEEVHNKGISLNDWMRYGTDLNKDGHIDETDLMMLSDTDAAICSRLWFSWKVNLYKSQNLANFFADWTMQDKTIVSFDLIGKHLGTRANLYNIMAEANKRDSKTLFGELVAVRKNYYNDLIVKEPQNKEAIERKLKRLEGLEYGKVTCADGRVITFNDDGTIISDVTPVKPKIDILAPYIFSYEDGYFDDGNGNITCYGITLDQWKRYGRDLDGDNDVDEQDLEKMTTEEGVAVLKKCYWDVAKADRIHSQNIANILVDAVWRIGDTAIQLVKEKLGLPSGTVMDAATLEAINGKNSEELFYDLFDMLSEYYDTHSEGNARLDFWWMKFDGLQYGELTCNNGRRISFKDDGTVTGDEIVAIETDDIIGNDDLGATDETQPSTDSKEETSDDLFDEGSGWDSSEWNFSDFDMDNLMNTEE